MSQDQLEAAVASATGEDRRTIARLGFSPLTPMPLEQQTDEPRDPLVVDWDELDSERCVLLCR